MTDCHRLDRGQNRGRKLAVILALSCLPLLAGCEVAGVLLHTVFGEPAIPAQYEPPKGSTLVLVENYRSPDEMQLDGDQIANQVGEELKKSGKLEVVDADKLIPMREDDAKKFRAMKVNEIGKAVAAKQVIYVDLTESAVYADASAGAVHGQAIAYVKVVDTQTGRTLWPTNASSGKELKETVEYNQMDPSHATAMHTQMLARLSSKIAKLFYTWKPDSQDEENAGG